MKGVYASRHGQLNAFIEPSLFKNSRWAYYHLDGNGDGDGDGVGVTELVGLMATPHGHRSAIRAAVQPPPTACVMSFDLKFPA